MKKISLISAAAVIVIANALALLHAARNRAGNPDAEITLTSRELGYFNRFSSDDDSGITLLLRFTDASTFPWRHEFEHPPNWLDRQKLRTLGFDCGVDPAGTDALRFYQRQRPRRAFVALEYDGAAWRTWLDAYERGVAKQTARIQSNDSIDYNRNRSRLVTIDADLDPVKLRGRYPDRSRVVILPAVVSITLDPFPSPGMDLHLKSSVQIVGRIQELPSSIHVPRPFSDGFRRLSQKTDLTKDVVYSVHLRYGSSLEPWVTGVEFTKQH
jgi:hypothetical protein